MRNKCEAVVPLASLWTLSKRTPVMKVLRLRERSTFHAVGTSIRAGGAGKHMQSEGIGGVESDHWGLSEVPIEYGLNI